MVFVTASRSLLHKGSNAAASCLHAFVQLIFAHYLTMLNLSVEQQRLLHISAILELQNDAICLLKQQIYIIILLLLFPAVDRYSLLYKTAAFVT